MIAFEIGTNYPQVKLQSLVEDLSKYQEYASQSAAGEDDKNHHQECCSSCKSTIHQLSSQVDYLSEKLSSLENYIKSELKKFDNPQLLSQSAKEGDFLLQEKWLVRAQFLHNAALDSSSKDLSELMETVFSKSLLKSYSSPKDFPPDLAKAFTELIGKIYYFLE